VAPRPAPAVAQATGAAQARTQQCSRYILLNIWGPDVKRVVPGVMEAIAAENPGVNYPLGRLGGQILAAAESGKVKRSGDTHRIRVVVIQGAETIILHDSLTVTAGTYRMPVPHYLQEGDLLRFYFLDPTKLEAPKAGRITTGYAEINRVIPTCGEQLRFTAVAHR
jgi:hypothetical protein